MTARTHTSLATQIRSVAIAVLLNTTIVLASTAKPLLLHFNLESIWTLFQSLLNCRFSVPFEILGCVAASHTGTDTGLAGFTVVETGTV